MAPTTPAFKSITFPSTPYPKDSEVEISLPVVVSIQLTKLHFNSLVTSIDAPLER